MNFRTLCKKFLSIHMAVLPKSQCSMWVNIHLLDHIRPIRPLDHISLIQPPDHTRPIRPLDHIRLIQLPDHIRLIRQWEGANPLGGAILLFIGHGSINTAPGDARLICLFTL